MSARLGVAVMAVLLVLYIVIAGYRGVQLMFSGHPLGVAMGAALVVVPLVAMWALGRELWFGVRAQQLGTRLEKEDALPAEQVAVRPSGRVLRDEADAVFPVYRADVEAHPDDWRAWYRLGLAYDASGDRKRAREAVRSAVRLERRA
ncbi:hypothetical protein ACFC3F_13285 [Microbacterium sp. NPDC055910]|uniref:hypothetical protein n=1 Tax=Microbacterium sp. NPDC055910 TaxID=3345659 RepID=UPI0035D9D2CF